MRIAEVAPAGVHPFSGVLTVIRDLAPALARRGHDVEVWQLSPWPPAVEAALTAAGVEVVSCHTQGRVRLGGATRRTIAARAPDVVHLHNSFSPANNLVAARLSVPYLVTAHGGYAPEQLAYHRWRKVAFAQLFERRLLGGANRVVALTAAEEAEITSFAPRATTVVIPNAVPPAPAADGAAFRRELGIGDDPLVVFVGKLDGYHKRVDELVEGTLGAPGWHVALVGPDWRGGRRRLAALAAQLGGADRVHLVGERRGDALHAAYAAADVFGLLSRWEGMSMSLLEAAAHGKPAVVSPEVEHRHAVAAAGAAWVAPPHELPALLGHIGELDAGGWERRAAAAREYAARHTWDEVARRYEAVLVGAVTPA